MPLHHPPIILVVVVVVVVGRIGREAVDSEESVVDEPVYLCLVPDRKG
jgi:hypothetical protein